MKRTAEIVHDQITQITQKSLKSPLSQKSSQSQSTSQTTLNSFIKKLNDERQQLIKDARDDWNDFVNGNNKRR